MERYNEIINFLIEDEQEAVNGYEKAIAEIQDQPTIAVLKHIVDEELEHIKELNDLIKKDCGCDKIIKTIVDMRRG